ncbi:alpha/beta hydrolase [Novosphingobium sp. MW5]|nr:alpha/beta hydrolase [Novosphingobium sp. MW5]
MSTVSTRHLVDPELLPLLDSFPAMNLSPEALPAIRAGIAGMLTSQPLPDLQVEKREIFIPSGEGDRSIRCLLIQPLALPAKAPVILHFHGGGHVLGTPEMNLPQLMRWAARLDCLVLSVDYRLAPETPFPGPMDDAYAALRWLNEMADELGIDRARVAVSGESAGGAMAASLCHMARDRGEYAIAFQHLEMPRLDDRLPDPPNPFTGEFIWRAENSEFCRAAYLAGSTSPYASAARADDLTGLPPAYIMVGALDLFVDECLAYTARLIRAGVPAELIVYPGCFHGFRIAGEAAVTKRADDDSLRALSKAFAR